MPGIQNQRRGTAIRRGVNSIQFPSIRTIAGSFIASITALVAVAVPIMVVGVAPAQAAITCSAWAADPAHGGVHGGAGTAAQPVATIRELASKLSPDQTGCVKNGSVLPSNYPGDGGGWGIINVGGTNGHPITIRAEEGGTATFSGQLDVLASDVILTNLIFVGPTDLAKASGFLVQGDRVQLLNSDFSYPKGICINVGTVADGYTTSAAQMAADDPAEGFVLDNNRVHDCGNSPDVHWNAGPNPPRDSGAHGIYLLNTHGAQITNNLVYDNGWRGLQTWPGALNTTISHNLFDNNATQVNIGTPKSDNAAAVYESEGTVITDNIMTNKVSTFGANWDPGLGESNNPASIYGNFPAGSPTVGNTASANCIDTSGPQTDGNGIAFGAEVTASPTYTDRAAKNFLLVSGSACIGKGPASIQPAVTGVPGAPTAVTGIARDSAVSLSWTAPASNGGSAITGYTVTPYVGGVGQPSMVFTTSATSQLITGLANGTGYTFKVAATNANGTGAQSTASGTLTPVAGAAGVISTVLGPTTPTGESLNVTSVRVDPTTNRVVVDEVDRVIRYSPDFTSATPLIGVGTSQPVNAGALAVGPTGTVYVQSFADVQAIATNGSIASVPGSTGDYIGVGADNNDKVYGSLDGQGTGIDGSVWRFDPAGRVLVWGSYNAICNSPGDGGQASAACFTNVLGYAYDAAGNVYVDDTSGATPAVRKVAANGVVTRVAGGGSVQGDGGQATAATLLNPTGVAVDGAGNFFIADSGASRIRKVATNGVITTIAGTGTAGFSGDNGAATSAKLGANLDVALNRSGDLFIADQDNHRLRVIRGVGSMAPAAPTNVTGVPASDQVTVSWTAPFAPGTSAITGYTVTPYIGGTAQAPHTFNSTAVSQAITGLTNGTAYTFKVTAINAVGNSTPSAPSAAITPGTVPSTPGFQTALPGNTTAKVSWWPPNNGGSPITQAVVTPYIGATAQTPQTFNTSSASVVLTGLTNGTTYTFKIVVKNAVGSSASSNATPAIIEGTPVAPGLVTGSPGNGTAKVSWSSAVANGSAVTGFTVIPYIGSTAQTAQVFNSTALSQTVTGLTNGTTYTFKVIAKNSFGNGSTSAASAPIVVGSPTAPAFPTAKSGSGQVTFSWWAPTANGSAITGYIVTPYIGTTAQTPISYGPGATTVTVSGLTNGVTYTFKVSGVNAVGTGPGSTSAAVKVGTQLAPTAVGATPAAGSASVHWTAPVANGTSAITGYVVTPYLNGVAKPARTFNSTATTQNITSLVAGNYTFVVATINAVGTGSPSAASTAVAVT